MGRVLPEEGDGLETGVAHPAARMSAARSAANVVFMAGYPLVLTLRLLITAFTPLTLQAMVVARCFISSLSTTPLR